MKQQLETLFDPSYLVDLNLPTLHQALMGLCNQAFSTELDLTKRDAINTVDAANRTALGWAALRGEHDAISRLLKCGANPNIPDYAGRTPLHLAASAYKLESVRELVSGKADLEALDKYGMTALHYAVRGLEGSEVVKALLKSRADMQRLNAQHLSVLEYAAWYNASESLQVLLKHGTEFDKAPMAGRAIELALRNDAYDALSVMLQDSKFQYSACWVLRVAARCVNIRGLRILLENVRSLRKDISEETSDLFLRYARYRRDHNQHWSEVESRFPDKDPGAWYGVFEAIIKQTTTEHAEECTMMATRA